ncbi:MAG: hypothetical protein WKF75_05975 [Singulisphaera sp.]
MRDDLEAIRDRHAAVGEIVADLGCGPTSATAGRADLERLATRRSGRAPPGPRRGGPDLALLPR